MVICVTVCIHKIMHTITLDSKSFRILEDRKKKLHCSKPEKDAKTREINIFERIIVRGGIIGSLDTWSNLYKMICPSVALSIHSIHSINRRRIVGLVCLFFISLDSGGINSSSHITFFLNLRF